MKLLSATLFLILIAASPVSSVLGQNDKKVADETNYKIVNGFSGYLTLDDYPRDHVQRWFDPSEIVTLSAMPTMKRGKTMGAFVELMGCKQNARGVCNVSVGYTIYKPDGSTFTTRAVRQRQILWKKRTRRTNYPRGLARMHFKLGKDDPDGEYKVKAQVIDFNANVSFEIELNFSLR